MVSFHTFAGYCGVVGSICCGYVLVKNYIKEKYDKEIEKFKTINANVAQANAAFQAAKAMEEPPVDIVTEDYDEPRSYTTPDYGYSSSSEYN